MEIISELDKGQFNEVRKLYADFFRSINFNNEWNNELIDVFSKKKTYDIFHSKKNSKYFFVIDDNKFVGFIHGKTIGNIGLINHLYVIESYRNKMLFRYLFKELMFWFKEQNISTIEIEINKQNNIYEYVERHNWQMVRDFDDASVFQRKI